jgi:hypothetical protein
MDTIGNKFGNIFFEIKKQISYIINDNDFVFSRNYINCMNEVIIVLRKALFKLQDIYYKYILYPKLKKI